MTPKSFFIIVIKIIGLYFLIDILRVVPQFLSTLTMLFRGDALSASIGLIVSVLLVGVYLLLVKYILFNPDKIVDKLRLDKNFDEEKLELNIHRSTVIKVGVIIVGGVTLLDYFVPLILNIYSYIKALNQGEMMGMLDTFSGNTSINTMDLVHGGIMTLLGYFLIANSNTITNWIERQRKK